MKSFAFIKRLVIAAVIVAAVSIVCDFGHGLDAEESFVNFKGRIVKIIGEAHIRRAGEKDWIEAKQGMELAVDDQITTGRNTTVDIIFNRSGQRSMIRILEEADMSLMTLNLDKVTGDSEILLDLAIGHIIIKTDRLSGKSRFEVLTPTCMTAVRGTGFEVKVTREGPIGNETVIQ